MYKLHVVKFSIHVNYVMIKNTNSKKAAKYKEWHLIKYNI